MFNANDNIVKEFSRWANVSWYTCTNFSKVSINLFISSSALTKTNLWSYINILLNSDDYITDVTPLKDLELLEALRLDDNPIQDTSVLESMEFYEKFTN